MGEELIKEIFTSIAFYAVDKGREIRLEKGANTSSSNVLNGAFSKSSTEYDSLFLHVYTAEERDEEEDAEECGGGDTETDGE